MGTGSSSLASLLSSVLLHGFLTTVMEPHGHHDHAHHDHAHHDHAHSHAVGHEHHNHTGGVFTQVLFNNLVEACPWLVLGLCSTSLLQHFGPAPTTLNSYLHQTVPAVAAVIGVIVPLCSCGALPIALSLIEAGVAPRVVVAFLTAAQSAGLDSAMLTAGLLGFNIAGARLLGALVIAIAAGMATPSVPLRPSSPSPVSISDESELKPRSCAGRVKDLALGLFNLFDEVAGWLGLGIVVTSLCSVHTDVIRKAAAELPVALLRLLVPLGSLPLQLCEHGTVAFASALQSTGVSPGTAFAFLVVAPATNLASLAMVVQHGGGSAAVQKIAGAIVISAAIMATVFDMVEAKFEAPETTDVMPELVVMLSVAAVGVMSAMSIYKRVIGVVALRSGEHSAIASGACCDVETQLESGCCEVQGSGHASELDDLLHPNGCCKET